MPSSRPNVLWILTTQWRAAACGYAGDPNARTPVLDALAAESVNYEQAVTPHPFGPFARAALLTGMLSPGNGVRDYFDPLPRETRTVAHTMGARGYETAFFGKWHLAPRDPAAPLVGEAHARMIVPPDRRGGFAFWEGFESGFLLNDPWLHGTRLPEPVRCAGYQSEVVGARAAEWLAGRSVAADQPWFAVVSLEAPHPPYDAPAAGVTAGDPAVLVLPPNVPRGGPTETKAREELAGYYAHIEATDRAVGRLLAGVRRGNTMVVFTSVHGDMHGAHGLFRKGWPYEESVRVPLLIRLPGEAGLLAAGRNQALVSLADLPALTLRGIEPGTAAPVYEYQKISMPSIVNLPHQCPRMWRGVRTRTRKLVLNDGPASSMGLAGTPWLFFDLGRDPGERDNLVEHPAAAGEIATLARLAW